MANYIVCLAHFCELHGPSIVICTQIVERESLESYLLKQNSKMQTCASCELKLPDNSVNLVTSTEDLKQVGPHCYISTAYPSSQKRYTSLTKLVMKSLSVETITDLSRPIFFGDELNGYCISKIFKIRDVKARGSERKYSLLLVSDAEGELLRNWDLADSYLSELITNVRDKVDVASSNDELKSSSEGTMLTFDNERFLRRSLIKPMSLVDLTNDADLFVRIHLWAVSLFLDIYASEPLT